MLIEFSVTNFRSFKEPQTFTMVAGKFKDHLKSNSFDPKLKSLSERLLRSSGIYGANAAGKTNLLRGLQAMQAFVINSATLTTGLPYTPFQFSAHTRHANSEFEVTFIQNEILYEYGFVINENRVEKEWLVEFINPRGRNLFERKYNNKKQIYDWKFGSFLKGNRSIWSEATRPNALFLSTAVQLNSTQLLPVFEWFQKRLVIIAGDTTFNIGLTIKLLKENEGKEKLLSFIKEADFGITDLTIKREPLPIGANLKSRGLLMIDQEIGQANPDIIKIILSHFSDDGKYSNLDLEDESNGTQALVKNAGAWINVLEKGEILLIDEIETSLHPLLVRFLVKKFHCQKNNPLNAQLIFTTQSTDLLDQDIMRRDQIWFVEKEQAGGSKLYPLSDFKPRNDEILQRWYLRGKYGALPILNISED